ncbi:hypothetical protein ACFSSA_07035 [Luteolibacter algae]|uniref:Uncharacterized protein n=1 Tax=Luteolibacter algae TaxID=454151 RepID=A0ABW5D6C7_9BACT
MCPIDPVETSDKQNQAPMSPPYIDDDVNQTLTEQGLQAAENEKRDAVISEYEKQASTSDEPEETLDDIEYPDGTETKQSPEISAMHPENDTPRG